MNEEVVKAAIQLMSDVKTSGLMSALAEYTKDQFEALLKVGFTRQEALTIITSGTFKVTT